MNVTVVPVVVCVLGKKPKKTGESGALMVEMEFSITVEQSR